MINTPFGSTQGQNFRLFTITNSCLKATVTDFGATLVSLETKDGMPLIVSLPDAAAYDNNTFFIGSIIVPYANRTPKATYELDGVTWHMEANENGNNLHSSTEHGCHRRKWELVKKKKNAVTLSIKLKDGELGFPGNRLITVTYSLYRSRLSIRYTMDTDKKTVFAPTSHAYFRFNNDTDIANYELRLPDLMHYLQVNEEMLPNGVSKLVRKTAFDFRTLRRIGDHLYDDDPQLKIARGYDHPMLVNAYDGVIREIGTLKNKDISMTFYSDMPYLQFYTANYLDYYGNKPQTAVCLEPEYPPSCLSDPAYLKPYALPEKENAHETIYDFKVRDLKE